MDEMNTLTINGKTYKVEALENLSILLQPISRTVALGEVAIFSVVAAGESLTYQWQWYKEATGAWSETTVTGNKTPTISVEATAVRNGYRYRCVVTDANGKSVTSSAVTLTVTDPTVRYFNVVGRLMGEVFAGAEDNTQGYGNATVVISQDGFVEVRFSLKVTTAPPASQGDSYTYGIRPELLHALDASIPYIVPLTGGSCSFHSNEAWDPAKNDLGGMLDAKTFSAEELGSGSGAMLWVPSRIYLHESGTYCIGSWPSHQVNGYHLTGVCYGIVGDTATTAPYEVLLDEEGET